MSRLDILALKLHPQLIKDLQVILQLVLETLQAIGEVISELRLDIRGDLRHVAVHILQELLGFGPELLRELMLLAVVADPGPLLNLPRGTDHVVIEAEGKVLRSWSKVLVVVVEAIVLVRLHLQVLCEQANHVEEAGNLFEGKLVKIVNGDKRQAFLDCDTLLEEAKLARAFELDDVRCACDLGLLLAFLPHAAKAASWPHRLS
mmetsp:Transcript_31694/g.72076  ORF Transcript_31694/g.72076 Transcript_31694/m.72076 type:complete len:204 (+) Transcript_31694:560-1171(+)